MEEKVIEIGENEELLNPMLDPIFKALFTSEDEKSKEALKDLISTCIKQKVDSVQVVSNEPAVEMVGERQIRYDINCVINNGEKINVEMTLFPSVGERKRIEYYLCKLFSSQKTSGMKWDMLTNVYQISIIGEEKLFPTDKKLVHRFEQFDKENQLSFDGSTRIITIELKKLKEIKDSINTKLDSIESWATFFKYANKIDKRTIINNVAKGERGVNMALQVLKSLSKDEKMRMLAISEEKRLTDYQIDLNTEKDFSFRKGREEGHKSGLEEGMSLGREEGRKLELEQVIRKMKLSGLSDEMIQSILEKK